MLLNLYLIKKKRQNHKVIGGSRVFVRFAGNEKEVIQKGGAVVTQAIKSGMSQTVITTAMLTKTAEPKSILETSAYVPTTKVTSGVPTYSTREGGCPMGLFWIPTRGENMRKVNEYVQNHVQKRYYATPADYSEFKRVTGTVITKIRKKNHPANNHFCLKDIKENISKAFTHSRGSQGKIEEENPVCLDGDFYHTKGYDKNDCFIQRFIQKPNDLPAKEISWYDLQNIDKTSLYKIEAMKRISEQFPKDFEEFQGLVRWIHFSKVDFRTKNEYMNVAFTGFLDEFSSKIIRK